MSSKKTKQFFVVCMMLFLAPFLSLAQQDSIKADRTQITDFYVSGGRTNFPVFNIAPENFKEIVPKSKLLAGNMLTVDYNNNYSDTAGGFDNPAENTSWYIQTGITLRLRNKEFKNAGPWIKLGLNYFSSSTFLSTGIFRQNTASDDSSYFIGTEPVTRVTTDRRELAYKYSCESINFEGTLIYKLNPEGIFSLFGGPGAMLGMNFNGRAELVETDKFTTTDRRGSSSGTILSSKELTTQKTKETFDLGPNMSFGIFVNVGVDLHLGDKFEVIKNMHAFLEAKPMFRMYGVKGNGMQNSILLVANTGLRYEF